MAASSLKRRQTFSEFLEYAKRSCLGARAAVRSPTSCSGGIAVKPILLILWPTLQHVRYSPAGLSRNCRETAGEVPPQVVTLVCLTPAELEELSRATSRLQQDRMLLPTSLRIASGAVQIQLAPVIGRIRPTAEIQPEIAQSLVDRQRARNADHRLISQRLRLRRMPLNEQAADLCKCLGRFRVAPIALLARPGGALVELDVFLADGSKNNRSEPAVSDRQSLRPRAGGLPVPELESAAVLRMAQARAQ